MWPESCGQSNISKQVDINNVSEPIEVGDHYIVAVINSEEKKGLMSVEAAKPAVENIIKDQKKAEIIKNVNQYLDHLKKHLE